MRRDDDSDDAYITSLITLGRQHVESLIGRALITQTWDIYFDDFIPRDRRFKTGLNFAGTNVPIPYGGNSRYAMQWPLISYLELQKPPVQSVSYIKYFDPTLTLQTLDPSVYLADLVSEPGRIYLAPGQVWPPYSNQRNSIVARCVCGYGANISIGMVADSKSITGAAFLPADVGKPIVIPEAGPNASDLSTSIAAVDGSGNATTADAAVSTVSGASIYWGLPIPANIQLAIKMVIANFYENREPIVAMPSVRPFALPIDLDTVLAPYLTDRF